MTDSTRREVLASGGFLIGQLSGWWPFSSDADEEEQQAMRGNGAVFVTDNPDADPTEQDGDVVFYV